MFLHHPKLLYPARMPTTQHPISFASFFPGGDFNSKVAKSSAKNTKTFLLWDFQYWQASTAIRDERKFPPFHGKKSSTATQKEKTERWFPFPMDWVLKFAHLSWQVLRIFESWGVILSYWSIEKNTSGCQFWCGCPWNLWKFIDLWRSTSATDLEEKGQMELFVLKQQNENGSQPICFLVNIIGPESVVVDTWVEWFLMSFKFSFWWFLRYGGLEIIFDVPFLAWNCWGVPYANRLRFLTAESGRTLGNSIFCSRSVVAGYFCNSTREPFFWYI